MKRSQRGFSLVEIMVAMVIGMISMVVIMQVFFVSEGQKRTTTGGADAQSNGAVAFYLIERDARMAGWGIDSAAYATCAKSHTYCDGSAACGGVTGDLGLRFASIQVIDGDKKPDVISSKFFSNPSLDTYRFPSTTTVTAPMPQPSAELNVASVSGCAEGDMALVSQGDECTLMQITQVQGAALKLQHNPGGNAPFNPSANYQKDNNWPAYVKGARVACFKSAPNAAVFERNYFIDSDTRQLRRDDNSVTPAVVNDVVAPEIVDLQVQYGIAPAGTQSVNEWTDATGAWANPSLDDWKRIKAIRIALVARSDQYEKPAGGGECVATKDEKMGPEWADLDPKRYGADFKCYRFKVFESVIPLRNVIWANL